MRDGILGVKPYTQRDRVCIDTIRTLAIDAVQAANSGHPGAPLSLAEMAERYARSPVGVLNNVDGPSAVG